MKQRHRAAIVLLVALLSFAFALEGSQPGHTHENGRLGLYNAECPLSQLAAVHADGWAPESPAVVTPKQIDVPTAGPSSGWAPARRQASPILALHPSPSFVSVAT